MRTLAKSRHATFVAGPRRGPAGLFAAYSIVRSESAVEDPHDTLTMLRWANARWTVDGRLAADHYQGFWDFPDNNLAANLVDSASAEAPVFDGSEGGGGGFGLMVAVRQQQRWLWARFRGCPAARQQCPPLVSNSNTIGDGQVVHGHLVGELGNCRPDCADSSVTYTNFFTWKPALGIFRLTRQAQHHR